MVAALDRAFREEWGRVLASLIGFLGDFDLAEEAAAEAFAIAAERWPRDGAPASPGTWLVTTARNPAIDRIRRDRTLAAKTRLLNEGFGGRGDLGAEAIRLGRALAELMPDEPEVQGLLAMMLLHDSRRDARFQDDDLVLLADQDRSLWDTAEIAEGRAVLDRALALRGRGPYVVQAAIAALHAERRTDWPQIAALYGELTRLTDSPVVELNRAVAVAEADGPEAGLAIADRLVLDDCRYLHSTRGELLRRLGRTDESRAAYARALALAHDEVERRFLERRLAELGATT